MYSRILVPLDGSPLAEQVLPYLQALQHGLGCPVTLLRAFNIPALVIDPAYQVPAQLVDQIADTVRVEAQEYLDRVAASLADWGIKTISTVALEREPASLIIREAEQESNTLIAMSTHGRSGVGRWVLGSVTDKVLRAGTNPMLVIRARPADTYSPEVVSTQSDRWATSVNIKRVAVPLDGSSIAEQVLPHAIALAKSLEAPIRLVAVASSGFRDSEATEYLNQVSGNIAEQGASTDGINVLQGNPAGALLDMLQMTPDCLVAMTTQGRSGAERWVMGSVTDRVVRYSGTPVLVVRAA